MAAPEAVLLGRARRAYEVGRLRASLPTVALVAPMVGLSILLCGRYAASACSGVALAAVLAAAAWRGQQFARGARAGLVAGLGPLLLPLALCLHLCAGGVCLLAPSICVAGGLLGGVAVGVRARGRADGSSAGYLAVALSVTALTGCMGCLIAGVSGVLGMAAGMAAGAAPALWWWTTGSPPAARS
ncbi:MAG TPA: hypothetical protein VFT38_04055 [Vicinamibacteria bacterium]|nr:hypothetical protein [Vicinamibacteria bacterium]